MMHLEGIKGGWYWRLSSFYFFYFALLGTLVPYWGLYLKEDGFSAAEIGLLMAVPQLTKLGAPNLWGWLADRTGQRLRIIRLGNLIAAIVFMGVFFADGFWWMLLVLAGFSFFWNAVLAQFEVVTLDTLGERSNNYSLVRLWGSVGFIAAVLLVGVALDRFPITLVPWVLMITLWAIWLCTLILPEQPARQRQQAPKGLMEILRRPEVLVFFLCAFLMQMSHGPYYTFYTIYLVDMGINRSLAGQLWALGVVAEVGLFLVMHRLLGRWSLGLIMTVSLLLAALRWLLIGLFADSLAFLLMAQVLHAASFGSFHAASIAWVHRTFSGGHAGQGQALYSSVGFGAGWALGAVLAGFLWDRLGGDSFLFAAGAALLAALLAMIFLLPKDRNNKPKQ